jgi:hypothetical protein
MDNIQKQVRLFRIIMIVLLVLVVSQCTFWIHQYTNSCQANHPSIQKTTKVHLPAEAASPIIQSFWSLLNRIPH